MPLFPSKSALAAVAKRLLRQPVLHGMIPIGLSLFGLFITWLFCQQLEWLVFDGFSRWSARQERQEEKQQANKHRTRQIKFNNSPVVLVLIDDTSLDKLKSRYGLLPWPRTAYVDIFKQLQRYQPSVMVFDGHFLSFQREDDQSAFDAIKAIPHLVLGMVHQPGSSQYQQNFQQTPTYYQLNLGVVNVEKSQRDGLIRSVRPFFTPSIRTPGVFPSLSIATALEYWRLEEPEAGWIPSWENTCPPKLIVLSENGLGQTQQEVHHEEKLLNLLEKWTDFSQQPRSENRHQPRDYPLQEDGSMLLRWKQLLSGKERQRLGLSELHMDISHHAIPLWKLLPTEPGEPKNSHPGFSGQDVSDSLISDIAEKNFAGKIFLLGSASSMHQDTHHTPLSIHQAGADIQATAIDNLLEQKPLFVAAKPLNFLITFLLFAGAILLRLRVRSLGRSILYTLGSMIIFIWCAFWLFHRWHFWIQVVTPEAFMFLGLLIGNLCLVLMRDNEVSLLEGHLSRLVSQSVFQEIRHMSRIITQGGRKLDITAMMVDIRNFTGLAESLPPQDVSALLNEFYEVVVDTVFAHRGTVDKFLGDGVMILFGAPLPDDAHGQHALDAALQILEKSASLTARWISDYGIETDIGISIHTGSAFVGFIGPKNKLEYTAIGDTINLCARLQEQAKLFNTQLIVSQATLDFLGEFLGDFSGDSLSRGHYSPPGFSNNHSEKSVSQVFRKLATVTVRGRETPIAIWTLAPFMAPD